jgi:tetratricopeptide (TPR) repeat protein
MRDAGNRASGRSANTEAVAWFTQALQVLARLPETAGMLGQALDLHLALRNPLTLLGDHERTLLELRRVQELAERVNDRRRLGRALSFEVNALFLLGHHREAVDSAHRARAVADELQDRAFRTATDLYAGRAHFYLGELDRAIDIFSEIVRSLSGPQVHEQLGLPTLPAVFARSLLAECLAHVGRFAEGADRAREAVALAESTRHPDTMLWAYHGAGVHHLVRREVAQATAALDRAHAICRTHDMPAYVSRVSAELGFAWALGGRVDDALVLLRRAVDAAAARKQATSYSQALLLLGEAALVGGRLDEAVEATRAALEHFRQRDERGHEAWALRVLADLAAARAPADLAEAEQAYRAAIALASRLGMHPLRARAELGLARVLRRQDSAEEAATLVAQACDTFRATGMAADLASATAAVDASA